MQTFGRHIIVELSDCEPGILGDLNQVKQILVQAALEANAQIMEVAFHKFSPQGISGVVVIAESHLSVHTWPECGYAAIDIYTCGETTDPWSACTYIQDGFKAQKISSSVIERGIPTPHGWYGHIITTTFPEINLKESMEDKHNAKDAVLALVS